jgi:hypothetical protein
MHFARALIALGLALTIIASRAEAAESTTATITGTVSSQHGDAVAGAHVVAASPSGRYEARTDARGAFRLLGVVPDSYTISVDARGYDTAVRSGITALPGGAPVLTVALTQTLATIGRVQATGAPIEIGSTSERFVVNGNGPRLDANASGLAAYTGGTVQGTIAAVPGIDLDTFGNAIARGGKVDDVVYDYDSVPIPQGLIAEPGGNIVGAQLATTGVAATSTTLAGFTNQGDNALGGIVDQIPLTGTYPSRTMLELTDGIGTLAQRFALQHQCVSPLRRRFRANTSPTATVTRSIHRKLRRTVSRSRRAVPRRLPATFTSAPTRPTIFRSSRSPVKRTTSNTTRRIRAKPSVLSTVRSQRFRAKPTRTHP